MLLLMVLSQLFHSNLGVIAVGTRDMPMNTLVFMLLHSYSVLSFAITALEPAGFREYKCVLGQ